MQPWRGHVICPPLVHDEGRTLTLSSWGPRGFSFIYNYGTKNTVLSYQEYKLISKSKNCADSLENHLF